MLSYELRKIVGSKLIIGVFLTFILLNFGLFWYRAERETLSAPLYKSLNKELETKTDTEKVVELNNMIEELENAFLADDTYDFEKINALKELKSEIEKTTEYDCFLTSINENAIKYTKIGIFAEEGFSKDNIRKTAEDYEKLEGSRTVYTKSRGINEMLRFRSRMIFQVFMAVVAAFVLVHNEKEQGLLTLCRVQLNGRSSNIMSRMFAVGIFSAVANFVFSGISLIFSEIVYGAPIKGWLGFCAQSLCGFSAATFKVKIIGLLIFIFIGEWLVCILAAFSVILFGIIFRENITSFIVPLSIIAVEGLLYRNIKDFSHFENLRYINLISFFDVSGLFANYKNLNICGKAVNLLFLATLLISILLVITFVVCLLIYEKKQLSTANKRHFSFAKKLASLTACNHENGLRHEAYKIFVSSKALFVLAAASVCLIISFKPVGRYGLHSTEQFYFQYVTELEGMTAKEAEEYFNAIGERIDTQAKTDDKLIYDKERAYKKLSEYRDYLSEEPDRVFIFSEAQERLFADKSKNAELGILAALLIILMLAGIEAKDYGNGFNVLFNSSLCGAKKVRLRKYALAIFTVCIVFLLVYIRYLISVTKTYSFLYLDYRADSVMLLKRVPAYINLGIYLIWTFMKRLMGLLLILPLLFFFGRITKSYISTVICCFVTVIIPMVLVLMGINGTDKLLFKLLMV